MSHSSGRRIVLVTGGNKGIGRAVCERLLSEWTDTSVILGSRDVERGRAAAADIVAQTGCDPSRVSCLCIDTASDESVRTAALQLQDTLKNGQTEEKGEPVLLYGIVNNAGVR
jgi:NAD(P)-dependent dehydrogenase (short-subunit alcohol dehydrogenase family)